jgi:hypothetical protein
MSKLRSKPTAEPFDPALNAGMSPPEWRQRAKMSKSEYFRRKRRQAAGEDPDGKLLPKRIRVSPQREIITFAAERDWQIANQVSESEAA